MIAKYLYKNLRWQFNKNPYAELVGPATTEQQYYEQLEHIADRYYPLSAPIDTAETEFCLNKIALSRAESAAEKVVLSYFGEFWTQYVRLKKLFAKRYMLFPADTERTRLETIAELMCKCTQFAVNAETTERLIYKTCEIAELTEREQRYLSEAIRLYRIKYYCATAMLLLGEKAYAEKYAARFLHPILLKHDFSANKRYSQATYCGKRVATVIDCMGQSAARLESVPARTETKLFVYANKRNVFDTFVNSRFGEKIAEFVSSTRTVRLTMRYYLDNNKEIRKCTLYNISKRKRNFTVEIPLTDAAANASYFRMGNALCLAKDVFTAVAVVNDNATVACYGETSQTFDVALEANGEYNFDIVTVYADNSPMLADSIAELERFGTTQCPYLWDNACSRVNVLGMPLVLTSHSSALMRPAKVMSRQLKYTYQLGNGDVATFLDNAGNSTTLLRGFVFGVGGEGVYSVNNGLIAKLNEHDFKLDGDKLIYGGKRSTLCITNDSAKIYDVEHTVPARTLFLFPLERRSQITYDKDGNKFTIKDSERDYCIQCFGTIESFGTNALECNEEKLRYKLSNELSVGNSLAICFARAQHIRLTLTSMLETPPSAPIIRESLVSAYLNYVNEKNVFCLNNRLKRPDCLTLAAICYTNPQYVRKYLQDAFDKGSSDTFYYDSNGGTRSFCDKLALPLAAIYYLNLVGELPLDWVKNVYGVLISEKFEDKELCIKALALLRAAKLNCFDRVKCLVEYNNLKKRITADSSLYGYAQAIGAVPLANPSKERLKDLCNKYEIPKCWYYVSQLENLYGLNISAGRLQIQPKVTAENVLEQFALNIAGKRIDTTFSKASVQCMTLNGQQCFAPFYAPSLKNEQNELVVSY